MSPYREIYRPESISPKIMANKQRNEEKFPPQSETKAEAQKQAAAQKDLMGDAAVDPLPLVDEEKDPIAQEIKQENSRFKSEK